jgi:segregation and condensation protein A
VFVPTLELTLSNLVAALKNLIQNFPKLETLPEVVVKKVLSLEEAITDLTKRVQSALKMSFSSFVKDKADKVNVIVSFLGMLELVKQGIVAVEQQSHFADINLESAETGVPKYL